RWRVDRWKSFARSSASSLVIDLETDEGVRPSARAAALKEPVSIDRTNASRVVVLFSRFICDSLAQLKFDYLSSGQDRSSLKSAFPYGVRYSNESLGE